MATTPTKPLSASRLSVIDRLRIVRAESLSERRRAPAVLAAAALLHSGLACAQSEQWNASLALQETATNNVNLVANDQRQSDLVTQLTPTVSGSERGSHTSLDAYVSLPILLYLRTGAENNSILPQVNLLGDLHTADRVAHLEGAVNISQQFFTPFGAQPQDLANATNNRYRASIYRLSPYIKDTVRGDIEYELRSNNTWSTLNGAPVDTSNSYVAEFLARAETKGDREFGWSLSYDYTDTTFKGQDNSLVSQLARAAPFYSVDPQLRVRLSVGYENNRYTLTSSSDAIYGVGVRWRPTERTNVEAMWEHRFFGSSYSFTFDHRTPLTVWNVQASRNITTYPQQIASLASGANVGAYLNELFLSAYPDAAARQAAVDKFMQDRGLAQTTSGPVSLWTEQIQLVQQQSATVGLIGARNSVFLSAYNVRTQPISAAGNPLPPSFFSQNDNTQTGAAVNWNNRLTQSVNLAASISGLRTVANAPLTGTTRQAIAQVNLSAPLATRMTCFIGARYQTSSSDITQNYNEAAVFAGLAYTLR